MKILERLPTSEDLDRVLYFRARSKHERCSRLLYKVGRYDDELNEAVSLEIVDMHFEEQI